MDFATFALCFGSAVVGHDTSKRGQISKMIGAILRLITAAVLLFASFSKAFALIQEFESLSPGATLKEALLIILEVVLSVALICLPHRRAVAIFGALLHGTFALYLMGVLMASNQHCGCFGDVEIPLVVLLTYDMVCSICLLIFPIGDIKTVAHRFATAIPVTMLLLSFFLVKEIQYSPIWARDTLECHSGDDLPPSFLGDVAGSAILLNGYWHVILVDENCGHCARRLEQLREKRLTDEFDPLIVIRIRKTSDSKSLVFDDFPYVLDLDNSNNWKIRTPTEFFVVNGVIRKCLNED